MTTGEERVASTHWWSTKNCYIDQSDRIMICAWVVLLITVQIRNKPETTIFIWIDKLTIMMSGEH